MIEQATKNIMKRDAKFFNFWRHCYQKLVTNLWYGWQFKLLYNIKIEGRENIPKENNYVVAANHLSSLDPFLVTFVMPKPVAFMAKKELFERFWTRWMIDWQGAFPVNREKLDVSTIKTVMELKHTNWVLGLFPQGTRAESGKLENIHKGFAGLAKTTKCNILPVGIIGSEKRTWSLFKGSITVKIGEVIPWCSNADALREEWIKSIQDLTGFEYVQNTV